MKKNWILGFLLICLMPASATVTVWAEETTLLEQVIYDKNNIKVSVPETPQNPEEMIAIPIHVENNTDEKVSVMAEDFYINECKVKASSFFLSDAQPGDEAYGSILISEDEYGAYGIDRVADAEGSLRFIGEDYKTIDLAEDISIKTDISGTYKQEIDGDGIVVCNKKGVQIVEKGIVNDKIFNLTPRFCVANDTDQEIEVSCGKVRVDGKKYSDVSCMSGGIPAGKRMMVKMTFLKKRPKDIRKLETAFLVYPKGDYSNLICRTDKMVIEYADVDGK